MMDRLAKRRETNRKSQQRSREAKEALLQSLQKENEKLKRQLEASPPSSASIRHSVVSPSLSSTWRSSDSYATRIQTPPPTVASVNLEACRQAFIAVLASVCDPHLNTIHAVCQKWAQSRGHSAYGAALNEPRPVNRPLNAGLLGTQPQPGGPEGLWSDADLQAIFGPELGFPGLLTPESGFIPAAGEVTGPLSVPYLEPVHPLFDLELDHNDIWSMVMGIVDMSKTDAEALASRITTKVRCYGYGPVVMKRDVELVCDEFPRLVVSLSGSEGPLST